MKKTDDIVVAVCNFILNTFASKEYKRLFNELIAAGFVELKRRKASQKVLRG